MVDDQTVTSITDPTKTLHVVRSHRVPKPERNYIRPIALLILLVIASPFLVTSVLPEDTPAKPLSEPYTAQTYAPLTFPSPPYVEPPVAPTEAPTRASRSAATTERTVPKPPSKVEIVISFAMAQQGKRYVFGTKGPSTYDCSGLVLAAYSQIGIILYHYTGVMITKGKSVARSDLQRGDLIFPSTQHVQIYLGNGKVIHASSGQGRVTVANLGSYVAARRLI